MKEKDEKSLKINNISRNVMLGLLNEKMQFLSLNYSIEYIKCDGYIQRTCSPEESDGFNLRIYCKQNRCLELEILYRKMPLFLKTMVELPNIVELFNKGRFRNGENRSTTTRRDITKPVKVLFFDLNTSHYKGIEFKHHCCDIE